MKCRHGVKERNYCRRCEKEERQAKRISTVIAILIGVIVCLMLIYR